MDKPCATFHLNTTQIYNNEVNANFAAGINNKYGSINALRTDTTWYNVDFKTILGDMYYHYEKFNISLAFITYGSAPNAYGTAAIDRTVMINLGGLPFNNCTYDTQTMSNNSSAYMGTITLPGTVAPGCFNFTNDMNCSTIYKPNNMSNIRIKLTRYDNSAPVSATGIFPAMDFFFHIYGVESCKKD